MGMDNSWINKRGRGIHLTIRDIDCKNFDAEKMGKDFYDMNVTFFSFFTGGYITTYPSKLKYSRISPWLGDQDITRDIVKAAHKYNIKAIAMADMSVLTLEATAEHPEWASIDINGEPYEYSLSGMYTSCIMSSYAEEYGQKMVREILENYDVDGIKFGGGSYGFRGKVCYCKSCQKEYEKEYHHSLPIKSDWNDPNWINYQKWCIAKTSEKCKFLFDMVKSIRPDMLVMGNGGCMGAIDAEEMSMYQDMVQVEGQTRIRLNEQMQGNWMPMYWIAEEASYMTTITHKPIWIVASYWRHGFWRRSAVDYPEQKVYMAQIIANGATPMVNLSGGPPLVHEDQRGFKAPKELFAFLKDHADYYDGDCSGANIALVYSPDTEVFYGKDDSEKRYIQSFRGTEKTLLENHLPYDVVSTKYLVTGCLLNYKLLILPTLACMSDETAKILKNYVEAGGSILATFETGLYKLDGSKRENFAFGDLLKASYKGITASVAGDNLYGRNQQAMHQNYCRIKNSHSLLQGIEDTELIPIGGEYCLVEVVEGAEVPLTLATPFIIFPEGLSYTTEKDLDYPMMIAFEHESGGRTVYLPNQLDKLHYVVGMEDISMIFANSVKWALRDEIPATCEAPNTINITFRRQENKAMVHLINFTGGQRYFKQLISVRNIVVRVDKKLCAETVRAYMLSDGKELKIESQNKYYQVIVPELKDYDVVVFETVKDQ